MSNPQMRSSRSPAEHPVHPGAEPLSAQRAEALAADPQRQHLIDQMLVATTQEEIAAARRAQRAWPLMAPELQSA